LIQFHEVADGFLLVGGDFDQREVAFQASGAIGNYFRASRTSTSFSRLAASRRCAPFSSVVGHDGHARDLLVLRRADGERVNIDGEAARKRRDAVQDTGFVST